MDGTIQRHWTPTTASTAAPNEVDTETTTDAAPQALGVLGGMGPAATADFLTRLTRFTPAACDQDHLPTIVYSNPQTSDRSDAILGRGPSPLPALVRGIEFLNQAGCALVAIPCNSAHHWYEELAGHSAVPILHIADAAAEQLRACTGVRTVGVLATDGTIRSGIYAGRLREVGISPIDLAALDDANPVMRGIRAMKAGRAASARDLLQDAGQRLTRRGAEALLVACTDASTALSGVTMIEGVPVLDALDCLVEASIARSWGPLGGRARSDAAGDTGSCVGRCPCE